MEEKAFSTEEEQLAGGQALANTPDTTAGAVEDAIPFGDLTLDDQMVYARYHIDGDDLVFHIFRGPGIPERFWGTGEFGLAVLEVAEKSWPIDKPKVEYHSETVRPEAHSDDPDEPPKYPPHYYGGYLLRIPGANNKPVLSKSRIVDTIGNLSTILSQRIAAWSNGS